MTADRLTSQLVEVSDIVGNLGLKIAEAQIVMNKDYIDSLQRLVRVIKEALGTQDNDAAAELLKSLAPPRYQYTETTLDFGADLAETKNRVIGGNVGVSFKALQVNASMTLGYGHDYRASARITTTLHAFHDPQIAEKLLAAARAMTKTWPKLPERSEVEEELYKGVDNLVKMLTDQDPPQEGNNPPAPDQPEEDE